MGRGLGNRPNDFVILTHLDEPEHAPSTVDAMAASLAAEGYLASPSLATALLLATRLDLPLLLEGEPGVGKTELAVAVARSTGSRLIRLQGHEGLDANQALYEWDHVRQLLAIRAASGGLDPGDLFTERYLLRRPLLEALEHDGPVVLLIDEVDRTGEEFDALLLELLSDFQVTIPELGTVRSQRRPLVILTSNRTRELHDALKRRCAYHWIDYPSAEVETRILAARIASSWRTWSHS
jgi:MoxR-like ATPase